MNGPSPETLLKYLARVYAFAQLVTPDPAAATRLVRATYQRAFEEAAPLPEGDALRLYLYRLLLDVRREERGEMPAVAPLDLVRRHDAPDDLAMSRERHAHRLVDLHVPPALVSLDTSARLLLLLCDVEGLSCDEAARVLEMPSAEACGHYAEARTTLRERVLAAVSVHERPMLDEVLTPERLRTGIAAALQDELAPLPPTLRPQITPADPPGEALGLPESDRFHPWIRAGYLLLLVFALSIAAYLLLHRTPRAGESNLIVLVARQADDAAISVETGDAVVAETFVEDHAGWQLSLPTIEGYELGGVGLAEVVPGVTLPVFRYATPDSARLTVYALNYSLLDQARDQIMLEPDVLEQLENDAHFELHDIEGTQVLLWRKRDDLFLAVSEGLDRALSARITP